MKMPFRIIFPLAVFPAAFLQSQTLLIDFGDTVGTTSTGLGNTWNNVIDSTPVTNMDDITGTATTIDIFVSGGGFGENGGSGGGGLASPSQSLLGDFAVPPVAPATYSTVTGDYFFTSGAQVVEFTLGGLDSGKSYNLEFFGTRDTSAIRETIYTAQGGNGPFNTVLQTSGTGSGSSGTGNDNTIVSISGLTPNGSDQITFSVTTNNSTFGYLGAMRITAVPEPGLYGLLVGIAALGSIALRRRR